MRLSFAFSYLMSLTFQLATIADLPLIFALAEKIWRSHYPSIIGEEQVEYMLATRYNENVLAAGMAMGEKFYLLFDNDLPRAYASIQLQDEYIFLHKFYVDVESHGKGLGSQFFEFLLLQMPVEKKWRLQVNRQNIKAINFYFKMGFVIETVGDFDIGSGYFMNDFVMIRK